MNETRPIRLLIGANKLDIDSIKKFPEVYKAKSPLTAKKVTKTSKKGKVFQQTVYVAQKVDKDKLELKNLSDKEIADFKRSPHKLSTFLKMSEPIAKHWYKTTNLKSVGIDFMDAKQEADISAYKALMAYKGGTKKQASLSTLVYTSIRNKYYNLYKKASNDKKKATTGSFDNIANVASVVDDNTKVEMKEAEKKIRDGIQAWADRGQISNKEYQELFTEWLSGMSVAEMARKRDISRPMIASKFKRVIYKVIESMGYTKEELSKEQAKKGKFRPTKKSEGDMTNGMLIIANLMARDIGVEPIPSDHLSQVVAGSGKIKMEALQKLGARIKDRKQEKLLFRYLKNFDMFSAPFVQWASTYRFTDIGNTDKAGFEAQDGRIVIYDSDSLPVMQYNVILALISLYIKQDTAMLEYVKAVVPDGGGNMEDCTTAQKNFFKEFKFEIDENPAVSCATISAFIYLMQKLGYEDATLDRYKKTMLTSKLDDTFSYVYKRIYDGV